MKDAYSGNTALDHTLANYLAVMRYEFPKYYWPN